MDITETLAPKSDQLDAVDLLGGPRTFTITGVKAGNEEQPVQTEVIRAELRGKDLSCWCAPDLPCHADVLLELANAGEPS